MDFPLICICGCTVIRRSVKKPPQKIKEIISNTDNHFYCLHCHQVEPVKCYQTVQWYTLFFIPIIPFKWNPTYIGCSKCKNSVQPETESRICQNCGHWIFEGDRFCSQCGELNDHQLPTPKMGQY